MVIHGCSLDTPRGSQNSKAENRKLPTLTRGASHDSSAHQATSHLEAQLNPQHGFRHRFRAAAYVLPAGLTPSANFPGLNR